MREIKFRGKMIGTNRWVYGHYAYVYDNTTEEHYHVIYENGNPYIVRMRTIGQFTGLVDKNGRDIYENDILIGLQEWVGGYLKKKYSKTIRVLCEVVYKEGRFKTIVRKPVDDDKEAYENNNYRMVLYDLSPRSKGSWHWNEETEKHDIKGDGKTCPHLEVAGNKIDNPELIK